MFYSNFMKCKNCDSNLLVKNNFYFCEYCGSTFSKEEFEVIDIKETHFKIIGGVLKVYVGNESNVIIPEGVISIGPAAFKDNLIIQSITFSNSVVSIENNAFEGCKNLKKLINKENIKNYGDEAFKFSGLTSVLINDKVDFIGKYCFSKMPNLETVTYMPHKNLKLNHTFAYCPNLKEVYMDNLYFFPSFHSSLEVRNNPNNNRPTWKDAFMGTPYIKEIYNEFLISYEKGECPECGGKIKKGIFHARCLNCGIDYKN